jgi:hypothetical protein
MNITEKSKEYAEGKALSAITSAIEDAYAAGYQEGYAAGYENRDKPEEPAKYNNVSYINLDLPSGTQWATGYLTKANGEIVKQEYRNNFLRFVKIPFVGEIRKVELCPLSTYGDEMIRIFDFELY